MPDAHDQSFEEVRSLLGEFVDLRRRGGYPRADFKARLEDYGFLPADAGRFAAALDNFFDDFQKELTRIVVLRGRLAERLAGRP